MTTIEKKRLTYDDYARLTPPDSGGYQLIDGEIIEMGTPTPTHQRILLEIAVALQLFVKRTASGSVFIAPMDVCFDTDETYQPDLFFIAEARQAIIGDKIIEGAPDLVMEILSPSTATYDLTHKRHIYEKFGVKEYWIIDAREKTIEVYANSGAFSLTASVRGTGVAASRLLAGFEIDAAHLF